MRNRGIRDAGASDQKRPCSKQVRQPHLKRLVCLGNRLVPSPNNMLSAGPVQAALKPGSGANRLRCPRVYACGRSAGASSRSMSSPGEAAIPFGIRDSVSPGVRFGRIRTGVARDAMLHGYRVARNHKPLQFMIMSSTGTRMEDWPGAWCFRNPATRGISGRDRSHPRAGAGAACRPGSA